MRVNVHRGTNAGWKKPYRGNAMPWQCRCMVDPNDAGGGVSYDTGFPPRPKTNPGHLSRCPVCGQQRPDTTGTVPIY